MFAFGDLENPDKKDPKFDDRQLAENVAVINSIDDCVYAVWDDNAELVSIIYQQQVFRRDESMRLL
jgi:transcription elongation factor